MPNDRVLIPVLHVALDAKCCLLCVYSYFHRQLSNKFILSRKCLCLCCMGIKVGVWAVGSIETWPHRDWFIIHHKV